MIQTKINEQNYINADLILFHAIQNEKKRNRK